MKRITSRHNPLVAAFRAVARSEAPGLLLDGPHLVAEAIASAVPIQHAVVTANAMDRAEIAALVERLIKLGVDVVSVTAPVMAAVSPVRSSSAIVAVAERREATPELVYGDGTRNPLVLIACDVQDPGNVGAIVRVAEAGAVGGSIEDYDPEDRRLYEIDHAAERIAAASEVAHALPFPFMLTARAENHIRGNPRLDDTIARLRAYEAAGADVLYAPGLRTAAEVRAVCEAVSGPVNVLATPGSTFAEIVGAGGQRVSVGGGLAWVAIAAMMDAAKRLAEGDMSVLSADPPPNAWFLNERGA